MTIHVDTVREVDRDDLLEALAAKGLELHVVKDSHDLYGLEIECDDDCTDLIHAIDGWLTENRLPLVPQQVEGRIILRPPMA
jgi:hypothetical protein